MRQGGRLYDILQAGEWRSPAFLKYLGAEELKNVVVDEAHGGLLANVLAESDED